MSIKMTEFRSSSAFKWVLTLTVVLITALEILDGTIVSVSIRNMQGSLAATKDQLSWMMTGYMITSAIVVLMSGYLSSVFGRRLLVLVCIVAFGLFSVGCGLSTSPIEVIIFRMLQGTFGGLLAPLAQSILNDTHDADTRPIANALYGMGLMTAPVFGPILGGVITDHLGWRWDFFINIPMCVMAWVMIYLLLPSSSIKKALSFDWVGFVLIVIGVGFLQYVLDNGNDKGWLDSPFITTLMVTCILALVIFIVRGIYLKERNIVNFVVMADRSFARSTFLLFIFCLGFIGTASWLPNYLEVFLGYPASLAGYVVAPRGLASAASMLFIPFLLRYISTRWMLIIAFLIYILGSVMMIEINLAVDQAFFLWANVLQGVASGFFFIPLATEAYRTMPAHLRDTASGLFNFFRTMGASVGVALFSTVVSRETQVNWHRLGERIAPFDTHYQRWLSVHGFKSATDPKAISMVANELYRQASTIAFADAFYFIMVLFMLMLPVVLVMRWRPRPKQGDLFNSLH